MDQQLTYGVKMLEVNVNMMGRPGLLNPTLIVDGENVILVDVGLPGNLSAIGDAMHDNSSKDHARKRAHRNPSHSCTENAERRKALVFGMNDSTDSGALA